MNQLIHPKKGKRKIINRIWNKFEFLDINQLVSKKARFYIRDLSLTTHPGDLMSIKMNWHNPVMRFQFKLKEMPAEEDRGAARLLMAGRHQAQCQDTPYTG